MDDDAARSSPPARTHAQLMTPSRDTISETVTAAANEAGVPPLIEESEIIAVFGVMIIRKPEADLAT